MAIEALKHSTDGGAVAVAVASWLSYLPDIAAVLSICWLVLRIYETVLNLRDRRKK